MFPKADKRKRKNSIAVRRNSLGTGVEVSDWGGGRGSTALSYA